jgi:hypothetical protein
VISVFENVDELKAAVGRGSWKDDAVEAIAQALGEDNFEDID